SAFTARVSTSRGVVRGFRVDYGSNRSQLYYGAGDVFLGVPFAQPPLGEWRFQLPRPICRYPAEVGELAYKPRCIQNLPPFNTGVTTSEDCLFLNVFNPNVTVPRRFPVMVWVHGGAFASGGADQFHYKGAIRNLVSNGVVVVTLQYRLGMLGFFTTYTPEFPANRGLFDQILAFRWVKEEIGAFGGNPDRITAFGESAGAVSISGLSLSPLARGLFSRLAITSGSVLLSFQVPNDVRGSIERERAAQLCNVTGDPLVLPTARARLQACLQQMTAAELISREGPPLLTSSPKPTNIGWSPARDGVMFPSDPEILASSRPSMDALVGDMKEEYAFFMSEYSSGNISHIGPASIREALLNRGKGYLTEEQLSLISSRMISSYQKEPLAANDNLGWTRLIVDAMTGEMISSVMRRDVNWLKLVGSRVFLFTFDYPSSVCSRMPSRLQGFNGAAGRITAADVAVANNFGRVWTNFAKFGNPGWTESGSSLYFMRFDDTLNVMGSDWRGTAERLYNQEFPGLIGDYPPTKVSPIVEEILAKQGARVLEQWNRNLAMC
ncbi:hypothetical protein PMAYCL1PPCAC_01245, partial [Pristionchus mayeri]